MILQIINCHIPLHDLLHRSKKVSFYYWSQLLQMGISDGLGSRKLEVLADTAVTLEQSADGAVVIEVIKKMLKVCVTIMLCVIPCLFQSFKAQ